MLEQKWQPLNYETWKETYQTLHLWTQIVGKIRLCKDPWVNHSWSSTFYVTPRGLTTSAITHGDKNFSIDFDFLDHQLVLLSSDSQSQSFPLQSETVATFYNRVLSAIHEFGIEVHFDPKPNEVQDTTPFNEDTRHKTYNREHAYRFWQVLVPINNVFKEFRSRFIGKCSPVHFFWGSFDLALTRFSGRRAPEHPGGVPHLPDIVSKEAYSHEVSSCGFWPGNETYPHAAFYSYAYEEPSGFKEAKVQPPAAFYHPNMREFILSYDDVRMSPNPHEVLLSFLQSTYEAAANLGEWNRKLLEESSFRKLCSENFITTSRG